MGSGPWDGVRVESRGAGGGCGFLGSDSHSAVTVHSPAPAGPQVPRFKEDDVVVVIAVVAALVVRRDHLAQEGT